MGCDSSHSYPSKRTYNNMFLKISPIIQIETKSIFESGIIDTASNRTCINRAFVIKHGLEPFLCRTHSKVKCSSGDSVITEWEIPNTKIIFHNHKRSIIVTLCVIEKLPVPLLIGMDSLQTLQEINLDLKNQLVHKDNIVLINSEQSQEGLNIPDSIFEDSIMTDIEIYQVKKLLNEYKDIFCVGNKDAVCKNYVANIPMIEGKEDFVYCPSRNIPIHYRARAKEIINQWLEDGKIEPAQSSFNSPILIVEKPLKKGQEVPDLRLCIDFRELNKRLPHDPVIPEKLSELMLETGPHKYRSSFDLPSAYLQIQIRPEDRHRTAFCFLGKQYQFCTLPFGLKISGSTFIRVMSKVMTNLDRKKIRNYVDDFIITDRTFEEHLASMRSFFEAIKENGLKLAFDKCNIGKKDIKFLGIIIYYALRRFCHD